MTVTPTRQLENQLLQTHSLVAGIDEVGRGALAGPVMVGVAVVDRQCTAAPAKLKDSKLLTATARANLVGPLQQWLVASGVGEATAKEIDEYGIIQALRMAAHRALALVMADTGPIPVAILDGKHNWLQSEPDLFVTEPCCMPEVVMQVKADTTCAVVAAASVLAKVERDNLMMRLTDSGYGLAKNKGYGTAEHLAAIRKLGPSELHRQTWLLPTKTETSL